MDEDLENIVSDDIRYKRIRGDVVNTEGVIKLVREMLEKPEFKGKDILCLIVDKENHIMFRPKDETHVVLSLHIISVTSTILLSQLTVLKRGFEKQAVSLIHSAGICPREEECHYKGFFSVPRENISAVKAIVDTLVALDSRTIVDSIFLG